MKRYTMDMVNNLNNMYNEILDIDPWKNSTTADFRKILMPIAMKYNIPVAGAGLLFSYTYHIRRCPTVAYNSSWNMFDTEKEISDYRNNLNRFFLEEVLLKRRIYIRNNLKDLSHFFDKFATRKYERKLLKELIIKQHFTLSSTNFYYCCNKPENMKKMIKSFTKRFKDAELDEICELIKIQFTEDKKDKSGS